MTSSRLERASADRARMAWRARLLFYNFYAVYRADRLFRERFTPLGQVLVGTFVLAGVFGVNTRATLGYQLAVLSLALVLVGIAANLFFRVRFEAKRSLPRYATVGEPLVYTVAISHDAARTQRGLGAAERLGTKRPDPHHLVAVHGRRDAKRSWVDRSLGYPRWASMMRRYRGGTCRETALPDLPPRAWTPVEMRLTPERRGYLRLERLDVMCTDPLGVVRARVVTGTCESLLVLPRRYPVEWDELAAGARDRPEGLTHAVSCNGLDEFAALREYRPGDPLRHIHWRGWARLGTPIVKEFHEEFFARQALVLDVHLPASGTRRQFEAAVSVAASFASRGPAGSATLELMFVGTDVHRVSCGPGLGSSVRLLEALACVDMRPEQPFDLLRETVKARAGELSGCVCVFLDWDAPRRALVKDLEALGVGVVVLVVADSARQSPSDLPNASSSPVNVVLADRLEAGLATISTRTGSRGRAVPGNGPGAAPARAGG